MKKKRYPTYKRKYKRKKQPRRKILTAIILCVILAVCNGWMPPRSLKEVKDQSRIFGQVFLTYIEENAQILWEDISESAFDAVTGLLNLFLWIRFRNTAAVHMWRSMEIYPLFLMKKAQDLHTNFIVNWIPWGAVVMQNPRSHRS